MRLEQVGGPFSLIRFQARYDRVLAVFDLSTIGTKIVGLIEDILKVKSHIGIAGREGDGKLWKSLT